jgi:hypothetical protein
MSMTAQIECTGISFEPYTIIPSILKPLDVVRSRFNRHLLNITLDNRVFRRNSRRHPSTSIESAMLNAQLLEDYPDWWLGTVMPDSWANREWT